MSARSEEVSELRRELSQGLRDVRSELAGLRSELGTTYVTNAGLAGITTAWSTTLEKIELAFEGQVDRLTDRVTDLETDIERIRQWASWLIRIIFGAVILAVLALVGLSGAGSW